MVFYNSLNDLAYVSSIAYYVMWPLMVTIELS